MAIKFTLNPQNDQLVPVKAFKAWGEKVLEEKQAGNIFKDILTGEKGKKKRERIGEINNTIKSLPNEGQAWFLKVFTSPWGGKIDNEVKEIFDILSKENKIAELAQATENYNKYIKETAGKIAKAAYDLTRSLDQNIQPALANFAKEVNVKYPEATTEATTEANPEVDLLKKDINSLMGTKENRSDGLIPSLLATSSLIQDTFTKISAGQQTQVAESLTSKQKELTKLYFKKQILEEYIGNQRIPQKAQLNEFFLTAAIFAALAGVLGWVTGKATKLFSGINFSKSGYGSSGSSPTNSKEIIDLLKNIGNSAGVGYSASGKRVDINGKETKDINLSFNVLNDRFVKFATQIPSCVDRIQKSTLPVDNNIKNNFVNLTKGLQGGLILNLNGELMNFKRILNPQ